MKTREWTVDPTKSLRARLWGKLTKSSSGFGMCIVCAKPAVIRIVADKHEGMFFREKKTFCSCPDHVHWMMRAIQNYAKKELLS